MYSGFNLTLNWYNEDYYRKGIDLYNSTSSKIANNLDNFIESDGNLQGSKIQAEWFPNIPADIFLSHSHSDEKKAVALAGLIKEKFGLTVFIDSSIWGYCNDLLKIVDEKYCREEKMYNYNKRNFSTSHIHMMLAAAIDKMMDSTECLFFLNTPNSIYTSEIINKSQTASPWIYHELTTSRIIRKWTKRKLLTERKKTFSKGINESLEIFYDIQLDHLIELTQHDLKTWLDQNSLNEHPLDILYRIKSNSIDF